MDEGSHVVALGDCMPSDCVLSENGFTPYDSVTLALMGAFKRILHDARKQFNIRRCCHIEEVRPCPDKSVGVINDIRFPFNYQPISMDTHTCPRMILILESPHRDEYCKEGFIAPAKGRTGEKIARYSKEVFPERFWGFELILLNAVQFCCSQEMTIKRGGFKDYVFWKAIRNALFIQRLQERIQSIFQSATDVIVNACTRSGYGMERNDNLVDNAIQMYQCKFGLNSDNYLRGVYHPSNWWCASRRVQSRRILEGTNRDE